LQIVGRIMFLPPQNLRMPDPEVLRSSPHASRFVSGHSGKSL